MRARGRLSSRGRRRPNLDAPRAARARGGRILGTWVVRGWPGAEKERRRCKGGRPLLPNPSASRVRGAFPCTFQPPALLPLSDATFNLAARARRGAGPRQRARGCTADHRMAHSGLHILYLCFWSPAQFRGRACASTKRSSPFVRLARAASADARGTRCWRPQPRCDHGHARAQQVATARVRRRLKLRLANQA